MATQLKDDEASGTAQQPDQPTITPGAGSSDTSATGSTDTGTPTTTPPSGTPSQDVGQIANLNQGFDWNPLLDFVKGQGTQARSAIDTANKGFQSQLGTFNPFGATDQSTLMDVLSGKQGLDVGKGLLNKQYGGPSAIDRTQYDPQVQRYAQSAGYTANDAGIGTLLGEMNPAISQGDRAYDALVFGQNPMYQQQAQQIRSDAGDVTGLGDTSATNAQTAIGQRKSDIGSFNQAATGFVGQQRDAINQAINSQMNNVNAQQTRLNTEMGQLQSGQKNFSDFDPSDFGFNVSQYAQPTTVAADQHKYISPAGSQPAGAADLMRQLLNFGFPSVPAGLTPQQTAQMAPNAFSQSFDPRQFLNYSAGQPISRIQAATADQARQYDIAEQLLNENDYLDPAAAKGMTPSGKIGLNSSWQDTLAQAQQQAAATDAKNAAWLQSHQQLQNIPLPPGSKAYGAWQAPTAGIPIDAQGNPLTSDQLAAVNTQQAANPWGYTVQGNQAMPFDPRQNPTLWAQMTAGSGDTEGAGQGSQEVTGGPGGGFAKGGMVKMPTNKQKTGPKTDALNRMGGSGFNPFMQQQQQQQGPQGGASILNPIGQLSAQSGGFIPKDAGIPGQTDSVPVKADAGEYVVTKPAVQALGKDTLDKLNMTHKLPLHHQAGVRNALHAALSKAARI